MPGGFISNRPACGGCCWRGRAVRTGRGGQTAASLLAMVRRLRLSAVPLRKFSIRWRPIRLSDEVSREGEQSTSHRLPVLVTGPSKSNKSSRRFLFLGWLAAAAQAFSAAFAICWISDSSSPIAAGQEFLQATSVSRPDVRLDDADQARLKWLVRTCRFRHKGPMVLLPFRCLFRQLFAIETRLPLTRCE